MPYLRVRRRWEGSPPYVETKTFFFATDEAEAYARATNESRGSVGWIEEQYPTTTVSPTTRAVLKALCRVSNGALYLRTGRDQFVMDVEKTVVAVAELQNDWPRETALLDSGAFLKLLDHVDYPLIEFMDDAVIVHSPVGNVVFKNIDASYLLSVIPPRIPSHDHAAVEWYVSADELSRLLKAVKKLRCSEVIADVRPADGESHIELRAQSASQQTEVSMAWSVPIAAADQPFQRADRFSARDITRLPSGGYHVRLANWKYGVWMNDALPIVFYIRCIEA